MWCGERLGATELWASVRRVKLALASIACVVLLVASCLVLYRSAMVGTLVCGPANAETERCVENRRTFGLAAAGVGVALVTPVLFAAISFVTRKRGSPSR